MLNLPFNHNSPSALSVERIHELNALALRAQVDECGSNSEGEVREDHLVIETSGMQEVYDYLSEFDAHRLFYYNIDRAFSLLLEKNPGSSMDVFNTYTQLTSLFRTIARQKKFIERRMIEVNKILKDIDTLEAEGFKRKRGGSDNV